MFDAHPVGRSRTSTSSSRPTRNGSIEAIKDALSKIDQTEVRINVLRAGVGGITETDVMLADASDAIVIGFNVRPEPKAKVLAEQTKVDMRLYRVIYKLIEDINAARVGMLAPDDRGAGHGARRGARGVPRPEDRRRRRLLRHGGRGHARRPGPHRPRRHDHLGRQDRLAAPLQGGREVGQAPATSAASASTGFQDIKEGDVIEAYKTVEVAREE